MPQHPFLTPSPIASPSLPRPPAVPEKSPPQTHPAPLKTQLHSPAKQHLSLFKKYIPYYPVHRNAALCVVYVPPPPSPF